MLSRDAATPVDNETRHRAQGDNAGGF